MLRDYLRLSMKSLRRRSLRSWLTILGIVVGVAAVVALIAIGEGMQRSVQQQFDTIGYNTIILGEATGKATGSSTPTTSDGRTADRGGAQQEQQTAEEPKQIPEGKDESSKPPQGRSAEEIEALKAQYENKGEAVDLDTLRGELLAAVERGKMTPVDAARAYVTAGVQGGGEWTRAEAASIMQQFVQDASAQAESSGEATPDPRDDRGTPQTALVTTDMSSMEVLESLADLSMVAAAGAQRNKTAMVTSEGLEGLGILRLIGMTPSMPEDFPLYFEGFAIGEGRAFTDDDLHVVVLGTGVANDLVVGVGDEIMVQGTPFEVIGILAEPEQPASGGFTVGDTEFSLFVPIPALESLFGGYGSFSTAFIEVEDGTNIEAAVQQVRGAFMQAGTPISATTASELSAEIGTALSSVNLTLSAIAGIALLVGVLGVMNTMYMSVLERTREIGIMKAIGAKDCDVLGLFLIESSLLGFIGGAFGIFLGAGISGLAGRLISSSLNLGTVNQVAESAGLLAAEPASIQPAFSPWLILAALGLSLVLGALAGVLPAWRGAKLPPVKALRYE